MMNISGVTTGQIESAHGRGYLNLVDCYVGVGVSGFMGSGTGNPDEPIAYLAKHGSTFYVFVFDSPGLADEWIANRTHLYESVEEIRPVAKE